MATAPLREVQMAYSIDGRGEPLILIGGFTMVKESWKPQIAALAEHFQVVCPDNRGAGETIAPPGPFTIADMAADTVGLMDALGIDSAHVFGVSMGGLIAQTLALDHAARVGKVSLGCTTYGGRHAVQPEREVMEILARASDPALPAEEAVRGRLTTLFSDRFIREQPDELEAFVQFSIRHWPTPEGAAGQLGALGVFNVKRRLGEIRCPVLAITGSEDRMMPAENSRLLADGIEGARHYSVDGAGHMFFLEQPDLVNRVLIEFFSR